MVVKTVKNLAVVFMATSAIVTLYAGPVKAQGMDFWLRDDVKQSIWSDIVVNPNSPLSFSGEGAVKASGRGDAKLYINEGSTNMGGTGVVGIKTSNDSVESVGWDGKENVGDWTFYWGEGGISVKGDNYNIISYLLPGRMDTQGNAGASFEGDWKIQTLGFNKLTFEQILKSLIPDFIKERLVSGK
ncbi:hypothetical protein HYT02_00060 [Candidatus Gottesmanbacteria bacterium]|nr:hypothetical protein [Candidatus Gottesmanbacteria bacterium]